MKTARQLGITAKEYEALLKVRDLLSKREVLFNMSAIISDKKYHHGYGKDVHNCGTVGCIGGWMAVIMRNKLDNFDFNKVKCSAIDSVIDYVVDKHSQSLHKLFYPALVNIEWSEITPSQAICAIDNFMNTGDPDWLSIVPENS